VTILVHRSPSRTGGFGTDRLVLASNKRGFVSECPISRWERLLPIEFALRFTARLVCLFSVLSVAQQTAPPPNSQAPAQTEPQTPAHDQKTAQETPSGKKNEAKEAKDASDSNNPSSTSKDRLFYALPNFLSLENVGHVPPLTAKQKFGVVARGTLDPVQFAWYGFLSGLSQAQNSEPGFGQGAAGYGKRFGSTAADGIIENFMTQAVLPSILRQDPRFFQSGKGGFTRRAGYAVSRIFVTRTDAGGTQFNYSEIFGSAMSAAISTYSYHPRSTYISTPTNPHLFIASDRTLVNTASVWGSQVGYDTISIVIREFWPDIRRKMSHKHKSDVVLPRESLVPYRSPD
jgi:hypothetical protein